MSIITSTILVLFYPVTFLYRLINQVVLHTIIIPLQLAFKITIYIPFIKIPILDPLIYLLELQDFKIRDNEQWIINQINLFLITGIHYVGACLIIGAGVGIWMGINLSLINLILKVPNFDEKSIDSYKIKKTNSNRVQDQLNTKIDTTVASNSNSTSDNGIKGQVENYGKGVIIPDVLPNLSKSRILQKIQRERFLRQQQQRLLAERRLAESQFQEIQRNPDVVTSIEGDLQNEEPVADEDYGESIEVVGLEDDGYAYTGGLRNRIDRNQQVHKSAGAKLSTGRNSTGLNENKVDDDDDSNSGQEAQDSSEDQFEVEAIEGPILKPIPPHNEEQEIQNEVDGDETTGTANEGSLSNIPEETEEEEEEEEEEDEEVFTSRAETTENTLM